MNIPFLFRLRLEKLLPLSPSLSTVPEPRQLAVQEFATLLYALMCPVLSNSL